MAKRDVRRIFRLAETLLAVSADQIAAEGYAVPDMRFVSPGLPVFDDAMMCVSCPSILPLNVADSDPLRALHQRAGEFSVWLVLPSPTFDTAAGEIIVPDAADMNEASEWLYASILAGIDGVLTARSDGTFATKTVTFLGAETAGPEGGFMVGVTRWQIDLAAEPS